MDEENFNQSVELLTRLVDGIEEALSDLSTLDTEKLAIIKEAVEGISERVNR